MFQAELGGDLQSGDLTGCRDAGGARGGGAGGGAAPTGWSCSLHLDLLSIQHGSCFVLGGLALITTTAVHMSTTGQERGGGAQIAESQSETLTSPGDSEPPETSLKDQPKHKETTVEPTILLHIKD